MVSHSLNSLKEYCDVALFLGRDNVVHYFDNVENAIKKYLEEEKL
jgi:capsular polysaccharide transport system ATP-binding protein